MEQAVKSFDKLPLPVVRGTEELWSLQVRISVRPGSFLHIGGANTPLSDVKQQVFKVDGIPAIPATSLKGALRHQLDLLFIEKGDAWARRLGVPRDALKPCIPSSDPTRAERDALSGTYRVTLAKNHPQHCGIDSEHDKITPYGGGVCPVCYFLGAPGLPGFVRVDNFFPESRGAQSLRIEQPRLRIDREVTTAAHGALVTSEQVKPGTVFRGVVEICRHFSGFEFGRPRTIAGEQLDPWLVGTGMSLDEIRLFLVNECLLPALRNITVLGGQKSLGAGKVAVEVLSQ